MISSIPFSTTLLFFVVVMILFLFVVFKQDLVVIRRHFNDLLSIESICSGGCIHSSWIPRIPRTKIKIQQQMQSFFQPNQER